MNKIRKALHIQFDEIEPTADGYVVSNSSNPDRESVWLSREEWWQLCCLAGWAEPAAARRPMSSGVHYEAGAS
jgi:hypothetical protein